MPLICHINIYDSQVLCGRLSESLSITLIQWNSCCWGRCFTDGSRLGNAQRHCGCGEHTGCGAQWHVYMSDLGESVFPPRLPAETGSATSHVKSKVALCLLCLSHGFHTAAHPLIRGLMEMKASAEAASFLWGPRDSSMIKVNTDEDQTASGIMNWFNKPITYVVSSFRGRFAA